MFYPSPSVTEREERRRFIRASTDILHQLAQEKRFFSVDDLWKHIDKPSEPRWVGHAFLACQQSRVIRRTSAYTDSAQGTNNNRPVRIWRSLCL